MKIKLKLNQPSTEMQNTTANKRIGLKTTIDTIKKSKKKNLQSQFNLYIKDHVFIRLTIQLSNPLTKSMYFSRRVKFLLIMMKSNKIDIRE